VRAERAIGKRLGSSGRTQRSCIIGARLEKI